MTDKPRSWEDPDVQRELGAGLLDHINRVRTAGAVHIARPDEEPPAGAPAPTPDEPDDPGPRSTGRGGYPSDSDAQRQSGTPDDLLAALRDRLA